MIPGKSGFLFWRASIWCAPYVFGNHTVNLKKKNKCYSLSYSLLAVKGNFLDREVHTNHEISVRRSRFNICFEKHGMVFPRISFQSSQTERFLVGYCEKELRQKHAPKK